MSKFWFRSSHVTFAEGEDSETSPGRYGKAVANWLASELQGHGYTPSESAEDWGWRIDCTSEPCPIWVGCGNVDEENNERPNTDSVVWHLFVEADVPFFKKLFGKLDPTPELEKLCNTVKSILSAADHIMEVEEP